MRIFEKLTYLIDCPNLLEKILVDKSNFWFLFKKFMNTKTCEFDINIFLNIIWNTIRILSTAKTTFIKEKLFKHSFDYLIDKLKDEITKY